MEITKRILKCYNFSERKEMGGDKEFDDNIEPQKDRESFVFDDALFEIAKEAKSVIEEEEQEDKDGETERKVDTARH